MELVKFFNEYGLKTKFSCQGHPSDTLGSYYIMFDNIVTDDDIKSFIVLFNNIYTHSPFVGEFVKWMRKISGEIVCNWMYQITGTSDYENWARAKIDLKTFRSLTENKI